MMRYNNFLFILIYVFLTIIYNFLPMINRVSQKLLKTYTSLIFNFSKSSSVQNELINVPPPSISNNHNALKENIWRDVDESGKKSEQTHLSKSQQWIKRIPVIKVTEDVVRCLGGTQLGTGHPQVYIQVNTKTPGEPVSCKWCGLRYALDLDHHH